MISVVSRWIFQPCEVSLQVMISRSLVVRCRVTCATIKPLAQNISCHLFPRTKYRSAVHKWVSKCFSTSNHIFSPPENVNAILNTDLKSVELDRIRNFRYSFTFEWLSSSSFSWLIFPHIQYYSSHRPWQVNFGWPAVRIRWCHRQPLLNQPEDPRQPQSGKRSGHHSQSTDSLGHLQGKGVSF